MLRKKKNNLEWLEFEQLSGIPGLVHGVFSRRGGVSQPPFDSLNVAYGPDNPEDVRANRALICAALGLECVRSPSMEHGGRLIFLNDAQLVKEKCDAFATDQPKLGLMVDHADCQSAIFYDPVKRMIANVHCGWRGNVCNIYKNAVEFLKVRGCRPENLLVCISPSLGPEKAQFIHYEKELPVSFRAFQFKPLYFDLWAVSRSQLEEAGVLPHHIEIAGICTHSEADDFFSYRRDKLTGRNGTIVGFTEF